MTYVYILTITDWSTGFSQVVNHSVWDTHENAQAKALSVTQSLTSADVLAGADTFDIDICQMGVHTKENL